MLVMNLFFIHRWANCDANHNPTHGRPRKIILVGGKVLTTPIYWPHEQEVYDVYHVDDLADPPTYFDRHFHPFHGKARDTGRVWRYKPGSCGRVPNRRFFYFPEEFTSKVNYEEWAYRWQFLRFIFKIPWEISRERNILKSFINFKQISS